MAADPGTDPALAAFCAAVHPRLVGALVVATGDRELAADLAQEALCRLCERWPQVRAMDRPEGWVFTVAFNLARSWWRRSGRAARALVRLQAQEGTHPGGVDDPEVDERQRLLDAVATLPPRQRQVVALRFYADCSVRDTARAMGCAEGTVKSLTAKATSQLRTALADPGGNGGPVAPDATGPAAQPRGPGDAPRTPAPGRWP